MFLHIGDNFSVSSDEIIGIFDIEKTSTMENTKEFLRCAGENGQVVTVSYEMPKSFIVCVNAQKRKIIYISRISASVLRKRLAQSAELENWRI